eukprot:18278-Heterococcus_DN1.PRE.4
MTAALRPLSARSRLRARGAGALLGRAPSSLSASESASESSSDDEGASTAGDGAAGSAATGAAGRVEGAYDAADYVSLNVSSEIKDLFQYILRCIYCYYPTSSSASGHAATARMDNMCGSRDLSQWPNCSAFVNTLNKSLRLQLLLSCWACTVKYTAYILQDWLGTAAAVVANVTITAVITITTTAAADRYKAHDVELDTSLKCFVPDYIPTVGEMDAFVKVPRPDGQADGLGFKVLDEPTANQSDATVLELQLRAISKKRHGDVAVRSIENAHKSPQEIERWIASIAELHRSKPPAQVHYKRTMPDIDSLMEVWPEEFEHMLGTAQCRYSVLVTTAAAVSLHSAVHDHAFPSQKPLTSSTLLLVVQLVTHLSHSYVHASLPGPELEMSLEEYARTVLLFALIVYTSSIASVTHAITAATAMCRSV